MMKDNSRDVLLSIKKDYSRKIFDGVKKFEFRRKIYSDPNVKRVMVYETNPTMQVVGYFTIKALHRMEIPTLWECFGKEGGIKENDFFSYFLGVEIGYAIEVEKVFLFHNPLPLRDLGVAKAPQSFRYIDSQFLNSFHEK